MQEVMLHNDQCNVMLKNLSEFMDIESEKRKEEFEPLRKSMHSELEGVKKKLNKFEEKMKDKKGLAFKLVPLVKPFADGAVSAVFVYFATAPTHLQHVAEGLPTSFLVMIALCVGILTMVVFIERGWGGL